MATLSKHFMISNLYLVIQDANAFFLKNTFHLFDQLWKIAKEYLMNNNLIWEIQKLNFLYTACKKSL